MQKIEESYYSRNRDKILEKRKITRSRETAEQRIRRLDYLHEWQRNSVEYRKKYDQLDSSKYKQYKKQSAKRRNIEFSLTYGEFIEIFHSNCTYCGQEDSRGIDRVDNSIGYIKTNSVGCCKMCNFMKHSQNKNDFIKQCKKIAWHN